MDTKATFTVEEAAAYLGISRKTAYAAVNSGQIPCLRIQRRIIVPRAALERMLAEAGRETVGLRVVGGREA